VERIRGYRVSFRVRPRLWRVLVTKSRRRSRGRGREREEGDEDEDEDDDDDDDDDEEETRGGRISPLRKKEERIAAEGRPSA